MSNELSVDLKANVPAMSKDVKELLQQQSQDIATRISAPSAGLRIRGNIKNGTIQVGELEDEMISVVVIDFITKRTFYDTPWRDGDPYRPPVCYGFSKNPDLMVPHENVEDIGGEFQSDACSNCPLNEWGSDGAGKACKERRVMLVLPPDEANANDDFWELDIPVKSLKSFDSFVRTVKEAWDVPPVAAIVDISLDPSANYVQYVFSNPQPNPLVGAHAARIEEASKILAAKRFEAAEEEQQGNRKITRKKVATKKVATRAKK